MEPRFEEFDVPIGGGFITGSPEGIGESHFGEIPELARLETAASADADTIGEFRRTLGMFATGVTIITTRLGEQVHGMTANAFMSVSLRPPLVLISVDRRARMHALLNEGARYGISVLSDGQERLSDHFAGRASDEAFEARFEVVRDTPLVEGAIAHLVARVVRSYWGGDHSLFVGQVEYARHAGGRPLLVHGGKYEHLLHDASVISLFPDDVLARLTAGSAEQAYGPGETIVRAGEPGAELFVILEGEVRIERDGRTRRTLGPGDFFGEIAVLTGGLRTADVIATEAVRCLAVPRELLREAVEAEPVVGWELLEVLAGRLRDD